MILSVAGFGAACIMTASGNKKPVITFEEAELEVPLYKLRRGVMEGITAYDKEDGDLTDSVKIDRYSNFIEKGVFRAHYTVSDSNGNMGTADRLVRISNYHSPEITLTAAPVFSIGSSGSIQSILEIKDQFNGKIDPKACLYLSNTINPEKEGEYKVTVQVSNSYGDVVQQEIPVWVAGSGNGPMINLSEYMIYLETGSSFDSRSYIESITDKNGNELKSYRLIVDDSDVDVDSCGTYLVKYICQQNKNVGYSALAVIVTEKGQ